MLVDTNNDTLTLFQEAIDKEGMIHFEVDSDYVWIKQGKKDSIYINHERLSEVIKALNKIRRGINNGSMPREALI